MKKQTTFTFWILLEENWNNDTEIICYKLQQNKRKKEERKHAKPEVKWKKWWRGRWRSLIENYPFRERESIQCWRNNMKTGMQ